MSRELTPGTAGFGAPAASATCPSNRSNSLVVMMPEEVFEPKYSMGTSLGLAVFFLSEAFLLWYMFSKKDTSLELILIAAFFGYGILRMPFVHIRRITFESQSFTVEKYLLPAKTIHYSDVVDIGNEAIKTRQGNIQTRAMNNTKELYDLLKILISEGKINRYQMEYRLVWQENLSRYAGIIAGVISMIILFASFTFLSTKKWLVRDPRVFFLIIYFPIYFLVYLIMKNKAENQ
jgi:hypothetical protein